MAAPRSASLVLFGVTGDLAHKMIFPALYKRLLKHLLSLIVSRQADIGITRTAKS
jgi:glucose-6-phosphate 1-dehydrogenase